jgi:divalent metal cation (Fe/Co/Zn/Cd) transporter
VEQDLLAQVREVLTKIEGVMNTHKLRARKMGHYTLVDVRPAVECI